MNKLLLTILTIFLASCAHQKVKTQEAEITEVKYVEPISKSVDSFVKYYAPVKEPVKTSKSIKEEPTCSREELTFLVKQPYEGLSFLKEAHQGLVKINQLLFHLLEYYPKIEGKEISKKEFNDLAKEGLMLVDSMSEISGKQAGMYAKIETYTRQTYYMCEEDFTKIMKKIDENKKDCILYQQRAYIEDPYEVKPEIGYSSQVEFEIQKQFRALVDLLVKYNQGEIPMGEFKEQYDKMLKKYKDGQYSEISSYFRSNVDLLLDTTYNIGEACEKAQ